MLGCRGPSKSHERQLPGSLHQRGSRDFFSSPLVWAACPYVAAARDDGRDKEQYTSKASSMPHQLHQGGLSNHRWKINVNKYMLCKCAADSTMRDVLRFYLCSVMVEHGDVRAYVDVACTRTHSSMHWQMLS